MHSELRIFLICLSSFRRKTTLTKHQRRSHPQGGVTPPSEHSTLEQSYQEPDNASASDNQRLLLQQSDCEQALTPNFEFNPQQSLQMTYAASQDMRLPTMIQNVPVMVPFDMQYTQQQYMPLMRQSYNQSHLIYTPLGFHQPLSAGYPMA